MFSINSDPDEDIVTESDRNSFEAGGVTPGFHSRAVSKALPENEGN